MTDQITKAAQEYLDRRDRRTHPDGTFDNAKRWYPSSTERCDCCNSIRSPSRAWPMSYMKHCRSAAHVASLYGVEARDLKRRARELEASQSHQQAA
ncbi:MAG TPA: hypothetical protein VK979_09555 [Guyparkeria sp.]|nr:hypothetical protein [Guyparkeria sp.]